MSQMSSIAELIVWCECECIVNMKTVERETARQRKKLVEIQGALST